MLDLKSRPSNLSICKISQKGENKNPLIWDQKTLIYVFFSLEFENNFVIFEISTLQFV